jgi:hypothetical protein
MQASGFYQLRLDWPRRTSQGRTVLTNGWISDDAPRPSKRSHKAKERKIGIFFKLGRGYVFGDRIQWTSEIDEANEKHFSYFEKNSTKVMEESSGWLARVLISTKLNLFYKRSTNTTYSLIYATNANNKRHKHCLKIVQNERLSKLVVVVLNIIRRVANLNITKSGYCVVYFKLPIYILTSKSLCFDIKR